MLSYQNDKGSARDNRCVQCVAAMKKACFRRVRLFMGADVVSTMSPCPPAVHPHTQNGGALGASCITTVMRCESNEWLPHSTFK